MTCTHHPRTPYDTYHRAAYDTNNCCEVELCDQCARDHADADWNILPRGWECPPGVTGSSAHKHNLTLFCPRAA